MTLTELRHAYHQRVCQDIVRLQTNRDKNLFPNFADGSSKSSIQIAQGMVQLFGCALGGGEVKEQTMGARFEKITASFLEQAFELLHHLRPGRWGYAVHGDISSYVQYEHLAEVERIVRKSRELASALGREYVVKPDIVVGRYPVADQDINAQGEVVGVLLMTK